MKSFIYFCILAGNSLPLVELNREPEPDIQQFVGIINDVEDGPLGGMLNIDEPLAPDEQL